MKGVTKEQAKSVARKTDREKGEMKRNGARGLMILV
jgi:hypothetical protein